MSFSEEASTQSPTQQIQQEERAVVPVAPPVNPPVAFYEEPGILFSRWQLFKILLMGLGPFWFNRLMGMLRPFMRALMLSHISDEELAANAVIASAELVITIFAVSVLNVIGGLISEFRGRKREQEVGDIVLQGSVSVVLTNAPLMCTMWFMSDILLKMGYAPAITQMVGNYFRWTMWGMPLTSLGTVARHFFTAVGHNKIAMANSISCFTILAAIAFPLTYLGYGPWGYAIATLSQSLAGFLINAIYLLAHPQLRRQYGLFSTRLLDSLHLLHEIWRRGWPIIVQWGCEVVAIFLRTLIAARFGNSILNAQGIAGIWEDLSVVTGFALSMVVGNRSGFYYGQMQRFGREEGMASENRMIAYGNLRNVNVVGLMMGFGYSTIIATLYSIPAIQKLFFRVFMNPDLPANAGALIAFQYLLIGVGVGQVFDLLRSAANGGGRGMRDLIVPALLNAVGVSVGLGLGWGLSEVLGAWALPISGVTGLFLAATGSVSRMLHRQHVLPSEPPLPAPEASNQPSLFWRCYGRVRGLFARATTAETQALLSSPAASASEPVTMLRKT